MRAMTKANGALRRRIVLAAVLAAAGLGLAPHAVARGVDVGLSVVDRETGQELPMWRHDGRLFVAGRPAARYGLRVENRSGGRVLVVMSVDGVNVLTGETASYDQRGYVLDPYQAYDVTGWRKSNAEVAAFNFAALSRSYAARTGRPGDVGVIGMAVFEERAPPPEPYADAAPAPSWPRSRNTGADRAMAPPLAIPPTPRPVPEASSAAQAPRAAAEASVARRAEKLGTAHGAREWSAVSLVAFERATPYPQATRLIEYDTYANLVARGVVRPYPRPDHRPRPFPLESGADGYVPDPPPGR